MRVLKPLLPIILSTREQKGLKGHVLLLSDLKVIIKYPCYQSLRDE